MARGSGLRSQDQGSPPGIPLPEFVESGPPETGPIVGDFQLDPDARVFSNPLFPTESVATAVFADPLVDTSGLPGGEGEGCVVAPLGYRAAFSSASHKFLGGALRGAGCSNKARATSGGIYLSASAVARAKVPGDGGEATSKPLGVGGGCGPRRHPSTCVPHHRTWVLGGAAR